MVYIGECCNVQMGFEFLVQLGVFFSCLKWIVVLLQTYGVRVGQQSAKKAIGYVSRDIDTSLRMSQDQQNYLLIIYDKFKDLFTIII